MLWLFYINPVDDWSALLIHVLCRHMAPLGFIWLKLVVNEAANICCAFFSKYALFDNFTLFVNFIVSLAEHLKMQIVNPRYEGCRTEMAPVGMSGFQEHNGTDLRNRFLQSSAYMLVWTSLLSHLWPSTSK